MMSRFDDLMICQCANYTAGIMVKCLFLDTNVTPIHIGAKS